MGTWEFPIHNPMVAQSDEAICVCTSSPFVLRVALAVECGHRLVSQRTRAVRLCAAYMAADCECITDVILSNAVISLVSLS